MIDCGTMESLAGIATLGELACLNDKKYGHAGTRTVFDKAERPTVVFELAEYRTDSYRVRKPSQHGLLIISEGFAKGDTLRVSKAGKPVCQRARGVYMGMATEPQSFEKRGECDKAASSHGVSLRGLYILLFAYGLINDRMILITSATRSMTYP